MVAWADSAIFSDGGDKLFAFKVVEKGIPWMEFSLASME